MDWTQLDLDNPSEFLTTVVTKDSEVFNLGEFPEDFASPPGESIANNDGFGELTIPFTSIGGFSGEDFKVSLIPSSAVNPITEGFPTGLICGNSSGLSCNGSATLTVSYLADDGQGNGQSVPEPLTIFGSVTALGFGALFKREYSRRQKNSN